MSVAVKGELQSGRHSPITADFGQHQPASTGYFVSLPRFMGETSYRGIAGRLTKLAGPIMVGQIGTVLVSFADTFMIGHYGVRELAAASFVNNLTMILVLAGLGFSLGLTPLVSDAESKGDRRGVGGLLMAGLKVSSLFAAAMAAILAILYLNLGRMGQPEELLPLIRSYYIVVAISILATYFFNTFKQFTDGTMRPTVSMIVIITSNLLNIAGNYVLIYGKCGFPELGLLGAGISTLFARIFTVAAMAAYFFLDRRLAKYREGFRAAGGDKGAMARIARLGAPISGQMAMETASFSVIVIIVGWLGTTALAAHQVMTTISQICYMMYIAVGSGAAILISSLNGQGAAIRPLSALFTDSPEVISLAGTLVLPFILYQFGDGMQICFSNCLRGIQQVKPILPIAFTAYLLVSIPCSYLFGFVLDFGLKGIWFGYPISLTLAGILYLAVFRRKQKKTV